MVRDGEEGVHSKTQFLPKHEERPGKRARNHAAWVRLRHGEPKRLTRCSTQRRIRLVEGCPRSCPPSRPPYPPSCDHQPWIRHRWNRRTADTQRRHSKRRGRPSNAESIAAIPRGTRDDLPTQRPDEVRTSRRRGQIKRDRLPRSPIGKRPCASTVSDRSRNSFELWSVTIPTIWV